VAQQVRERRGVRDVVDRHDLEVKIGACVWAMRRTVRRRGRNR